MQNKQPNKSDEEKLDAVVSRLRHQVVPPVPGELLNARPRHSERVPRRGSVRSSRRVIAALLSTAVVLFCGIWISWGNDRSDRNATGNRRLTHEAATDASSIDVAHSEVTMVTLGSLEPYAKLDRDLDELEQEIAELDRRATLLDLYRKTDALLAQD